MLKIAAIGVWAILVTAGATYGSVYLASRAGSESTAQEADAGIEELKSEMTSIPVIRDGDVAGYLILQLSFAADKRILEERKLDPLPFMTDAAFRVVFANQDIDFRRMRSGDLESLTAAIAKEANARIGAELVRHVLLQQLNFVRKEDIRTIGSGRRMSRNESAEVRPACEFLLDLGRSETRRTAGNSSEDELMRLADDPLSVNDFIRRHDGVRKDVPAAAALAVETSIALARGSITPRRESLPSACGRYRSLEPLRETSAVPTAFDPSHDDRAQALNHESSLMDHSQAPARVSGVQVPRWVLLAGGLVLLTLMILPS